MIRNIQEIHASIVSQARRGPTGGPHNALSDFLAGVERKGRKRKGRRRNREGERGGKGNSQVTLIHNGSSGSHHGFLIFSAFRRCQGYVPLTLDVVRVAFKVPLALHTPL